MFISAYICITRKLSIKFQSNSCHIFVLIREDIVKESKWRGGDWGRPAVNWKFKWEELLLSSRQMGPLWRTSQQKDSLDCMLIFVLTEEFVSSPLMFEFHLCLYLLKRIFQTKQIHSYQTVQMKSTKNEPKKKNPKKKTIKSLSFNASNYIN